MPVPLVQLCRHRGLLAFLLNDLVGHPVAAPYPQDPPQVVPLQHLQHFQLRGCERPAVSAVQQHLRHQRTVHTHFCGYADAALLPQGFAQLLEGRNRLLAALLFNIPQGEKESFVLCAYVGVVSSAAELCE